MNTFVLDISDIQARARKNLEQGPLTDTYGPERERVVEVLNDALATEIVWRSPLPVTPLLGDRSCRQVGC